jgi:tRNA nucleotidyltransferase/poly(A) polymerase
VRWAALLHDLGKPDTKVEKVHGQATFYEHATVGAALADTLLARLRFPAEERGAIVHLVREHMFDLRPEASDAAVRRWLRKVGVDAVADLFDLRIADALGKSPDPTFPAGLDRLRARIARVLDAGRALDVEDLAVDGRDVMRVLGVPPGPVVGRTLEGLLQEVLEDPARNRREHLLERLEGLASGGPAAVPRPGDAPPRTGSTPSVS